MKDKFLILIFLGMSFLLECAEAQNTNISNKNSAKDKLEENATNSKRPKNLQDKIDEAFEKNNKKADSGSWLYDGSYGFYELLGIDESRFFEYIVQGNPEKKDIYLVDVGCGKGAWAKEALSVLAQDSYKNTGKHFHIFSMTGSNECPELVEQHDNVTLYQFNKFKIENIDEELIQRGFDLTNKVDLIVSNWTMRHLVDPFGTLNKLYELLTPTQGLLLSNGFLFKFDDNEKIMAFPNFNENIVSKNSSIIFQARNTGRDINHFLLRRDDQSKLEIPLKYAHNTVFELEGEWQCASQAVTVFTKQSSYQKEDSSRTYENENIYCLSKDRRCKELYDQLVKLGVIINKN